MLLEKYGVSEIYAKVTSKYAVAYLNDKNTVLTYDIMVDHIINCSGTDMCPMEKAVLNVNNADEGEKLIRDTIKDERMIYYANDFDKDKCYNFSRAGAYAQIKARRGDFNSLRQE